MALTDITNFVPMSSLLSTSGQPTREQFGEIAADGYRFVINLALPSSDHAIPDEGAVVTEHGMIYVHIPVDFANPTETDLDAFLGVMSAFEGQKVWVHCVVNARVSAFCFHYLTRVHGYSAEKATSPILKRWHERGVEPVWKRFLAL